MAPGTATTPGHTGQLALSPGDFHLRAYPGQAAFPPPGARPPLAGNSGTPGKGRNREGNTNHRTASHLCDPTGPRAEKRKTQGHPVLRGGFHKAGEGPAFGDSFPDFSSGRNRAQRSVPGGGAGLRLRNGRRAKPFFLPLTKPRAYAPGLVCLFRKKSLPCVKGGGGFTGPPPKPSASGFGGVRRCDGVSETCPASQGRGE